MGSPQLAPVSKVSVSLPVDLTAAVRERVGPGAFSRYVASAVTRQLELDRLADLVADMESANGPARAELIAEAEAEWPDAH